MGSGVGVGSDVVAMACHFGGVEEVTLIKIV